MKRNLARLFILSALFAAAPLGAQDKAAPLQPGKYENWNGNIDRMEIVKTFSLSDYQKIRVEPLDTKTTPLPPAGDKRRAFVVNVLNRATDLFVEGMRSELHPRHPTPIEVGATAPALHAEPAPGSVAVAVPPAAPPTADGQASAPGAAADLATSAPTPAVRTLLIRAAVTEMNPGSKAARFWASFGAGHTDAEITGEILDADSGEVLARFKTGRASSGTMSLAGGNYETMMSNDTRDDGKNVGQMLTQFK